MSFQSSQPNSKPYTFSPPSTPSQTNFSFIAITILAILTTSILLLTYYVFVIKCFLKWHRADRSTTSRNWSIDHLFIAQSTVPETHGLTDSAINSIPTIRYKKSGASEDKRPFLECPVCLNEFQEDERIKVLPICSHVFHVDCICAWLRANANCPLCRSSVIGMIQHHRSSHGSEEVAIDVGDVAEGRKSWSSLRVGDEVKISRSEGVKRCFSMDDLSDGHVCREVHRILEKNPHFRVTCGESSDGSD